jgi:hypothetical protein
VSEFEKQPVDDCDWLAFRYIAGELSGDEAAAFEAELETSQVAREAVARAVDLSRAIVLAEPHGVELAESRPEPANLKSWIYGLGWVGTGAVAASVAGVVWWNMQGQQGGESKLAEAWSDVRKVDSTPIPAERLVESRTFVDVYEPEIAPAWMTAGVISLSGGKVDDDADGDGKPDESWDDEVMEN